MVDLNIDDREFHKAMEWLAVRSSKTLPFYLTRKLYYICLKAQQLTPKADAEKIRSELLTKRTVTVTTKKGKRAGRTRTFASRLAQRIIQANRYRRGEKIIDDYEVLKDEAKKFANRRIRSAGTLKAGWNGILRALGRRIGKYEKQKGPRVKMKGRGYPAKDGWKSSATAIYELQADINGSRKRSIHPAVQTAFETAWRTELASMREEINRRMQKDFKKVQPR